MHVSFKVDVASVVKDQALPILIFPESVSMPSHGRQTLVEVTNLGKTMVLLAVVTWAGCVLQ